MVESAEDRTDSDGAVMTLRAVDHQYKRVGLRHGGLELGLPQRSSDMTGSLARGGG